MKWSEVEKSQPLNYSGTLKMPVIYSPKVNAFAKLRSPFRFASVEMTISEYSL